MIFKNAKVYGADFKFHDNSSFGVEGKRFSAIPCGDETDLGGAYVIPGLIDIHNHGNSGADFSDGDYDGLKKMAAYLASNGVTSFAPASMTLPQDELEKAYATAVKLRDEAPKGHAYIQGINMEGPFFNEKKKGAQNGAYLRLPDVEFFDHLNKVADGMIALCAVAPELEGALDFIDNVSRKTSVSLGHTDANYDQAKAGIDAGATHVVHLFNAMNPFLHRNPGLIGAAAEASQVTVELISDGIHLHPSVVRGAFNMYGASNIVLVSDAMMACGMANGEYALGGQKVFVNGRTATLEDGTIAGSATNLFECVKCAISFGVPKEDAVRAATANPARVIGKSKLAGSIEPGKFADFVVLDDDFNIKAVYIKGEKLG